MNQKHRCGRKRTVVRGIGIIVGAAAVLAVILQFLAAAQMAGNGAVQSQGRIRITDIWQRYPLLASCPQHRAENYIRLTIPQETYAGPGDNGRDVGDGGEDEMFHRAPVAVFRYIRRQENSVNGFSCPGYRYDAPNGWVFSVAAREPCLTAWSLDDDNCVYMHVTENRLFPDGVGENWGEMRRQIRDSAEKADGVAITGLVFERYIREDGNEILCYSFLCESERGLIRYAVAYVVGGTWLAEFIGHSPVWLEEYGWEAGYDILEIVRYMAASFTETGTENDFRQLKYREYSGYEDWPYTDLHNPFAIVSHLQKPEAEPVFDGKYDEIVFASKEWEDLLRRMVIYHYRMSADSAARFMERPVYTSDLEWIREIRFVESPIPGQDTVAVNRLHPEAEICAAYNLTTLEDIAVLPNLEKLWVETGAVSDFEVLRTCTSLRELSIASPEPLTDIDWLRELPELEFLKIRVSRFSFLHAPGYEKGAETTFPAQTTGEGSAPQPSGDAWEAVLADCTSLRYLELECREMPDLTFLDSLPNLYAFCLYGAETDSEEARRRRSRFGDDTAPQVQCLVVDGVWLRNPE